MGLLLSPTFSPPCRHPAGPPPPRSEGWDAPRTCLLQMVCRTRRCWIAHTRRGEGLPPRWGSVPGLFLHQPTRFGNTALLGISPGIFRKGWVLVNHLSYSKRVLHNWVVQKNKQNKEKNKLQKLSAFWKRTESRRSAKFVFQGSNGAAGKHLTKTQPTTENTSDSPLAHFSKQPESWRGWSSYQHQNQTVLLRLQMSPQPRL